MLNRTIKSITIALALFPSVLMAEINNSVFLRSIAEVETGNKHFKVGGRGERSRYQIGRQTWKNYTNVSFLLASHADYDNVAHDVAVKHLEYIKRMLKSYNREINAYNCAIAWNGGLGAVLNGPVRRSTRDYANRVNNLYMVF